MSWSTINNIINCKSKKIKGRVHSVMTDGSKKFFNAKSYQQKAPKVSILELFCCAVGASQLCNWTLSEIV